MHVHAHCVMADLSDYLDFKIIVCLTFISLDHHLFFLRQLNMNGVYPLSATPGSKDMDKLFPNQYRDYPGGAEMFEVYSPPITTLYSQVTNLFN